MAASVKKSNSIISELKRTGRKIEKVVDGLFEEKDKKDQDILDTLHEEHEEVKALLKKLVDTEHAATRKSLLKQIKVALIPHARAEEKAVYNAIIAKRDKEAEIDGEEGFIEHSLTDAVLAKLSKISNAGSNEFSAGAKVLRELLKHHIDEEERNVWKDVKKHFNTNERLAMNKRYLALKAKVAA